MKQNWSDLDDQQQIAFILIGAALVCCVLSIFIDKWSYALGWFGLGLMVGGILSWSWNRF